MFSLKKYTIKKYIFNIDHHKNCGFLFFVCLFVLHLFIANCCYCSSSVVVVNIIPHTIFGKIINEIGRYIVEKVKKTEKKVDRLLARGSRRSANMKNEI